MHCNFKWTRNLFFFSIFVIILKNISRCVNCENKVNAHLLIDCDTCKNYYHVSCLSPPLHSVPKKTKLYGWECSKCVKSKGSDRSDNDEEPMDGPRSMRAKKPKHELFDIELLTGCFKSPKSKKSKAFKKYKKKV